MRYLVEGEQWAGVALPLVRKVFAQIAAKDFVSVQPMNLPSGLVFYLDFKYGTGTALRNVGDNMYGNVSTGSSKMSSRRRSKQVVFTVPVALDTLSILLLLATELVTFGTATSASVGYDNELDAAGHKTVTVDLLLEQDLILKVFAHFRVFSGSTDVTKPEFTTISGDSNVTFVIAHADLRR